MGRRRADQQARRAVQRALARASAAHRAGAQLTPETTYTCTGAVLVIVRSWIGQERAQEIVDEYEHTGGTCTWVNRGEVWVTLIREPTELRTLRSAHRRLREHLERAPDLARAVAGREDPAIGNPHRLEHLLEVGRAIGDAHRGDDVILLREHVGDERLHVTRLAACRSAVATVGDDQRHRAHRDAGLRELFCLRDHGAEHHARLIEQRRAEVRIVVRLRHHDGVIECGVRAQHVTVQVARVREHLAGLLRLLERVDHEVVTIAYGIGVAGRGDRAGVVRHHRQQHDLARRDVIDRQTGRAADYFHWNVNSRCCARSDLQN